MKKKENYIKYFTDNVDVFELPAYVCQAMFNLMKLANMSEEEFIKNMNSLIIVIVKKLIEGLYIKC